MEPEGIHLRFRKAVKDVNVIVGAYHDVLMEGVQMSPDKGTVSFNSSLHGYDKPLQRGFTQYIMTPLDPLSMAIMSGNKAKYTKMMNTLGIVLKGDEGPKIQGHPVMEAWERPRECPHMWKTNQCLFIKHSLQLQIC